MTLRLVGTPTPTVRRRPPAQLTREQRERVATTLRNLHRLHGPWKVVAGEMGFSVKTIMAVLSGRKGSMALAVRVAELAHIPVERLLTGGISDATVCPHCGQKLPEVLP